MTVTVKLFATLGKYLPEGSRGRQTSLEVAEGETVGDALAKLGVPKETAHLILVNGQHEKWGTALSDADILTVFPPVAGG